MDKHEIKCINKANRENVNDRILSIGGLNPNGTRWRISIERAIQGIEAGKWSFFVNNNGNKIDVVVASHLGAKYLKTKNDGLEPNNLLSLPECPI